MRRKVCVKKRNPSNFTVKANDLSGDFQAELIRKCISLKAMEYILNVNILKSRYQNHPNPFSG